MFQKINFWRGLVLTHDCVEFGINTYLDATWDT